MKQPKIISWTSTLIFIGIFLALVPVALSNNYLRQDDLMWEIWPWMRLKDFGYLYYNTALQLVRPICMISLYTTDLISIDIYNAVYIRFACIILIGLLGVMLFRWQLLFNKNQWLAVTFAITAFTLPGYQLFAATGNYSLVITALLLTITGVFFWHRAFNTDDVKYKRRYYLLGSALFFASFLDYPLSSMFVWAMILICYLNSLTAPAPQRKNLQKFCLTISILTIALMIGYYILIRLVHVIYHVNLHMGRAAVVDTHHLFSRLLGIFDILSWHSYFWFWDNTPPLFHSPLAAIVGLFIAGIWCVNYRQQNNYISYLRIIIQSLAIAFILFFLSYSPVLASPELIITFRYTLVTMPILLYISLWSITQIISAFSNMHRIIYSLMRVSGLLLFTILIGFSVSYANIMTADGIVGPHQHDFEYVQHEITEKVLPLLQQHKKVLVHAIDCSKNNKIYADRTPISFEYGMRICQYQQQIISVVVHSLRKMGYSSNYNEQNKLFSQDDELIVEEMPWGTMVVSNNPDKSEYLKKHKNSDYTIITIDMNKNRPYQQFEFYQNLIHRFL